MYITPPFKVKLNISIICKTIKIKISTRNNQNTHKKEQQKHSQKVITKTPIKWSNKNTYKGNNKKKTKNIES